MVFNMHEEQAHQIAVGLSYRQINEFIAAAKRNTPEDYKKFKEDYLAKQAAQITTPVKTRNNRNRKSKSC